MNPNEVYHLFEHLTDVQELGDDESFMIQIDNNRKFLITVTEIPNAS